MSTILLYLLDWSIIAISFFNTIILLWLGLTVLFNAERRVAGTWVAGGGLLLGGLFFAGHSAVVGRVIGTFEAEMELWWRIGWLPFLAGPYLWYLVIAWYTGVLHLWRHRIWLLIVSLLGLSALVLLVLGDPLPSYDEVVGRAAASVFALGGIPIAILIYPVYSLLCIVLALAALRRPAPSTRFMGELARRRAFPWLIAASAVLLLVSLAVGSAATWFLLQLMSGALPGLTLGALALLIGFDLVVAGLIAVAAIMIGQAIVSYEVFTGKALPRGGLQRHWRRSLIFAAGYSALIAVSLTFLYGIDAIYRLLLATVLMTFFVALLSWRSYADRERSIEQLRPFIRSQQLFDRLFAHTAQGADLQLPFQALCDDLLNTRVAYLATLGPLTPLIGPLAASSGSHASPAAAALAALANPPPTPQLLCLPIEPERYGGAIWYVPLWSERGLIGALLLGEKRDGGIYTQEEIEIARATGERLLDAAAGAEMSRRLMGLQRRRLAESHVLDRQTRRVLHDEVLPRIHSAMLLLGPDQHETLDLLGTTHRQIAHLLHTIPTAAIPEIDRLGPLGALQQIAQGELRDSFDTLNWEVSAEAEAAARSLPPIAAEVLFYAGREVLRNAARHGRGSDPQRRLGLQVHTARSKTPPQVSLIIADDGVGMPLEPTPRSSTGDSGGHGLALHTTLMAVVGGFLSSESMPGRYTRVSLTLPLADGAG
ncbi:MAG TPA: ATP-binding protein [Roseiflexaceae bacterium]|nr:ATP-binding protein [Roseiflexaceae bacterium]